VLGSASTGSYLVASLTATAAIAGPIAGALIDRSTSARRGFAVSLLVMAVGVATIALAIGRVPLPVVIALAIITGLGYPALTGAWSAQLPDLIPRDRLTRAYSADAATYSVAAVVAPPAATALVGLSAVAPLGLTALLLIVALVTLRFVPLRTKPRAAGHSSLRATLRAGASTMTRIPALRRSTLITTVGFAGQAPVFVAAPILALEEGRSLGFTGVILGTFAVGGLLSAAWFTRRPVVRPDRAIIVSTILSAVFLLALGLAPTTPLLLAAAFAMGASEPPLISAMFRVRVRESPPGLQAQVFSTASSLRTTAYAIATAISGWLLGWGIAWVIGFGIALHIVGLILGLLLGPSIPHRHQWLRRA
jgi:MFS family permease